ncbi:MAG: hypothetical protein ACM3N9_04990, partial [Syntrophothermus sp.]
MIIIEKYNPNKIYTSVYEDTRSKTFFVKRFVAELSDKKVDFTGEEEKNKFMMITRDKYPMIRILFDMKHKLRGTESEDINVHEFIGLKGVKAKGKRLTIYPVKKIEWMEPLQVDEPETPPEPISAEPAGDQTEIIEPVTEPSISDFNENPNQQDERDPGEPIQMELF